MGTAGYDPYGTLDDVVAYCRGEFARLLRDGNRRDDAAAITDAVLADWEEHAEARKALAQREVEREGL